jgi:hypothetical protein
VNPYYTVIIPWSDTPTIWHPTERFGPFKVLSRGAFATEAEAHAWAEAKLGGQPYEVRLIDDNAEEAQP